MSGRVIFKNEKIFAIYNQASKIACNAFRETPIDAEVIRRGGIELAVF